MPWAAHPTVIGNPGDPSVHAVEQAISHVPAGTVRSRVGNSGMPGGTISARGRMRLSGAPSSSSSRRNL